MFESFSYLIRLVSLVFLTLLTSVNLACDTPVQPEGRLYPPTTIGKRFNEAIRQNVASGACESQAKEHLGQKQAELVKNVDLLFSHFGSATPPDSELLSKRVKWISDHDLEPLAKELARLFEDRKVELQTSLTTLFGDTLFALPSRDQIYNGLLFLKRDDLKTLEKNVNATLGKWADPRNKDGQEIVSIMDRLTPVLLSDEGRFVAETFLGESIKHLPSESQVYSLLELVSREEIRSLLPLARQAASELLRTTHDETKEAQAILGRFQALAESVEGKFLQTTLLGENPLETLSLDDVYHAIEVARRPDVRALLPKARSVLREIVHPTKPEITELVAIFDRLKVDGPTSFANIPSEEQFLELLPILKRLELVDLLRAPELEEALTIAKRVDAFTKTPDGKTLINFTKLFIQNADTRKALLDLSQVLETQDRFSRTTEKFGIGLVLGDYFGSSFARAACAIFVSSWYKIDKDILTRLLDFGVILYREGVIDDLLRLEEITNELANKHPVNADIMRQIAAVLGITLAKPPRAEIEAYLNDQANQDKLLSIIDSVLLQNKSADLIRLAQIGYSLAREHESDLLILGSLSGDGLEFISNNEHKNLAQRIHRVVNHFAANPGSIFLKPQVGKDLARLNDLVFAFEAQHQTEISQLLKIAEDYRISIDSVTKENVHSFFVFIKDKKHQSAFEAIKKIGTHDGFLDDVLRLDALSQKLIADNSVNFELMKKLATEAGFNFALPPKQDVGRFLAFVSNPKNQQAAKTLVEISLEFGMFAMKVQSKFSSFPVPKKRASNGGSILDKVAQVSEEDFHAAWSLMLIGFDLWSLSPDNQCKPVLNKTHITPKDVTTTLTGLSGFLTSPDGLNTWLTLARRVASDTKS